MTMQSDAKFEEKLTSGLENDMRNLANFYQRTRILKIGNLRGSFYPKQKMYEPNIYRGVVYHGNEKLCKILRGIDFSFQN